MFRRPVEKRPVNPLQRVGGRDVFLKIGKRRPDVVMVFFEIGLVACEAIPFRHVADPPERVGPHGVHPFVRLRDRRHQVERFGQDGLRAKHIEYRHRLGMRVAHPHEPVALDSVPQIVLTAKMHRAQRRLPDAVQPFVGAPERPQPLHRAHQLHRAHELQRDGAGRHEIDAEKAEARVADLARTEPRNPHNVVADGVIVGRPFLADLAHGFGNRLPEPQPHAHAFRAAAKPDLDTSMHLASEVEQHSRRFAVVHKLAS